MANINLEYHRHWIWKQELNDNWDNFHISRGKMLTPEIHKWMSQHKVRHTLISDGLNASISIPDPQQAMLFKLTWL